MITMIEKLKVKKIKENANLPEYSLDCDIAFDVKTNETLSLLPSEQKEIHTGIAMQIPEGYIGLVRDRFGIVTRFGAHVIAGTFDSSYREEVTIMMINLGHDEICIEEGMRIAQIVLIPVNKFEITEVKVLSETPRSGQKDSMTGLK